MTGLTNRAVAALLFAWAAWCGPASASPMVAGETGAAKGAGMIEKYTLGNGLTVVIRENHSSPVVAVQVWVKAGSATEPAERAGMSHVLEHMAFKGTTRRGPGRIAREVEALGGEINAYTSFDETVYHITISGRYLANALDILADTLGHSVFDAAELAREKEVVLEELRMNEDNPARFNGNALFREAYGVHPYGRPVIGYDNTIRAITRDDLVSYFSRHYVPGNMVLVITGDVDPAAARPLIEKTFLPLKGREVPSGGIPSEPPQRETRVTVREREATRAYLDLAFHGPSMRDKDVFAWDLLSMILGSGETSRLNREVKDVRGLVDAVNAYAYTPKDPGLLMVSATGAAGKAKEALREILVQTFRLAQAPPDAQELARAKTGTESDFVYSLESQGSLARHVGFFETTLGDAAFEREYLRKIRAVGEADLVAVARKYLTPANLSVAAVVPRGEAGLLPADEVRKIAEDAYREAAEGSGGERQGESVVRTVLENGIRVIVREDRSVPVVAVEAGFLGGLRGEPADRGGVSTIAAEMLTKGTKERSAKEIAEAVENIAGDLSGFSGRNAFGLRARFMSRDFAAGLRLVAESLRSPTFPADELEKKRAEILGRIKLQRDEMARSAILLFLAAHYGDHPYARSPLGTEESVRGITRDDVVNDYGRWADPRNLVIAVSGDIGAEAAVSAVRQALGDMPRREAFVPAGPLPVPETHGVTRVAEPRDTEQAHFVIGYDGARVTDPDRYALEILGAALAGQGGRLFTILRDQKSLAYAVTSFSSAQVDPGFFAVYMGTRSDKAQSAISDTLEEIAEVREHGVTPDELDRAKKWMVGTYEIGLQSNSAYADKMMYNELIGIGYEETFRTPARIEAVTLEEVNRAAAKTLRSDGCTIAVLGGKEEADSAGTGGRGHGER